MNGRDKLYDRIVMGDHRTGCDCTSEWFDCSFRGENPTLGEFLSLLLEGGEWGCVEIGDRWNHNNRFEYSHGKIVSDTFTEQEKSRKIKLVKMSGGWSMMDYLVNFIEDATTRFEKARERQMWQDKFANIVLCARDGFEDMVAEMRKDSIIYSKKDMVGWCEQLAYDLIDKIQEFGEE